MFFDSTFHTDDQLQLIEEFIPGYDNTKHTMTSCYTMNVDLQLIICSMKLTDEDNHFTNTYINPLGSMHSSLPKDELEESLSANKPHKHDFIEFMFVLDGSIFINIEHSRHLYTKGSCYIINKNVVHAEEYSSDFRVAFLQLSTDFVESIYNDLCLDFFTVEKSRPKSALMDFLHTKLGSYKDMDKDYVDFIPNRDHNSLTDHVYSIFDSITKTMFSPSVGSSIYLKSKVIELFSYLSVPDNYSTTPVRIGSDAEYLLYTQIVSVMEKTNGRIARNELAHELNYSGTYLNEIVKKYSGLPLFDFGMTFCMKEAANLLITTRENITDIGIRLGFTNKTHFYKIFKNTYNMTPAEYRRHMI